MKRMASVFSLVILLTAICTVVSADVVPGAVLFLDAANNPAHPEAWSNLGSAGGELSGEGTPPLLEEGTIEIPALSFVQPGAMFYTA